MQFDPFVGQKYLAMSLGHVLVTPQISISIVLTFIFIYTHTYLYIETDRDRNAESP